MVNGDFKAADRNATFGAWLGATIKRSNLENYKLPVKNKLKGNKLKDKCDHKIAPTFRRAEYRWDLLLETRDLAINAL